MKTIGECPYIDYLPIEWSGEVKIMRCRAVGDPISYEKYCLPLNFNNTDDWLYLNDKYTQCSCASSMCSWFESSDFRASQKFRIYNVMPNIGYSVELSYPITLSVLNGCCMTLDKFNEVFSSVIYFSTNDIVGSGCERYAEFSLCVNGGGNLGTGDFSPEYFTTKYGESGLRIERAGLEIKEVLPYIELDV